MSIVPDRTLAQVAEDLGLKAHGDFNTGEATFTSPSGESFTFDSLANARTALALLEETMSDTARIEKRFSYRRIETPCDLSVVAIEQAVHMGLPPAYLYQLHVSPNLETCARGLVQHMSHHSPLTPVVNVHVGYALKPHEWFIESKGVAIGSEGVS